jgi:hypothetical protein
MPTEDKLFLSFNIYFLVFYNIHDHEFLELNYGYQCCVDCGEVGTLLSLSPSYIITFNPAFNFMHLNSQTINLVFVIKLNFVI